MKIKNKVLAIPAAPAAIPVNPKIAATSAITRKIADHLSIISFLNISCTIKITCHGKKTI